MAVVAKVLSSKDDFGVGLCIYGLGTNALHLWPWYRAPYSPLFLSMGQVFDP